MNEKQLFSFLHNAMNMEVMRGGWRTLLVSGFVVFGGVGLLLGVDENGGKFRSKQYPLTLR
jgi:hypothetical protein